MKKMIPFAVISMLSFVAFERGHTVEASFSSTLTGSKNRRAELEKGEYRIAQLLSEKSNDGSSTFPPDRKHKNDGSR